MIMAAREGMAVVQRELEERGRRRRWGDWLLHEDGFLEFKPTGWDIAIGRLRFAPTVIQTLADLRTKRWFLPQVQWDFLCALDDVHGLRQIAGIKS